MVWGDFVELLKWLLGGWLLLVMAIIGFAILSGRIMLSGLLRLEKNAPFGLDRLQLVAVTLFFAFGYALTALTQDESDLPGISTPLLLIVLGSNGAYLSVKYAQYSALIGGRGRGK